jgi:hypothetical protein
MKTLILLMLLSVVPTTFAQEPPLPEVLAVVNGVRITAKDFDADTNARVEALKRQVIEARKLELDLQINSILLDAEAKKRGVPTKKVLEDEVIAKVKEPTDADARKFFNEQYPQATDKSPQFEQVKEQIMAHLLVQRRQELAKQFAERLRAAADVKALVDNVTPPEKPADRARLFAVVNGKQITSADIENSLQALIFGVQDQIYELRRRDLNRKINDVLLAHEAQKRQVTTRALLDAEVTSKVPTISETQAQKFYDENKDKLKGSTFAEVKQQILWYLQSSELDKLRQAFAANLHKNAAVQDFLVPPEHKPEARQRPALNTPK